MSHALLTTKSRQLLATFHRGYAAGFAGEPNLNPYDDAAGWNGHVTFARAYFNYWDRGWTAGRKERRAALEEMER